MRVDFPRRGNPEGCEDAVRGNLSGYRLLRHFVPRNDETDQIDEIDEIDQKDKIDKID